MRKSEKIKARELTSPSNESPFSENLPPLPEQVQLPEEQAPIAQNITFLPYLPPPPFFLPYCPFVFMPYS